MYDMQYTKRDWRNRNQIKTPQGLQWLTIPVQVKGKYLQKICDTEIEKTDWAQTHLKAFKHNYSKAKYFDEIINLIQPLYENTYDNLSQLNFTFLQAICNYLGIKSKISYSGDYNLIEGKTERLADLCLQAGANSYISGPSAKDYIQETIFHENNIGLEWFDYSGYPAYPQLWGEFNHGVTILDLLFNHGKQSPDFMKYCK